MSLKDRDKWDSKYKTDEYITGKEPSSWLQTNVSLLAKKGKALDILQLRPHDGYDVNISGTSDPKDMADSDVVIIDIPGSNIPNDVKTRVLEWLGDNGKIIFSLGFLATNFLKSWVVILIRYLIVFLT